jgi:hypothetical protein
MKRKHITRDVLFDSVAEIEKMDTITWENAGRPHLWITVEKDEQFIVQFDCGYGLLRLLRVVPELEGFKEISRGSNILIHKDKTGTTVVLDKDYYSVDKYIWR